MYIHLQSSIIQALHYNQNRNERDVLVRKTTQEVRTYIIIELLLFFCEVDNWIPKQLKLNASDQPKTSEYPHC